MDKWLRKSPSQSRREQAAPAELVHIVDLDEMCYDSDDDAKSDLDDSETLAHVPEELPQATPAAHARERSMSRSSKSKADDSQPYLQAGAAPATKRSKLSGGKTTVAPRVAAHQRVAEIPNVYFTVSMGKLFSQAYGTEHEEKYVDETQQQFTSQPSGDGTRKSQKESTAPGAVSADIQSAISCRS